jgi:hypothetical protein
MADYRPSPEELRTLAEEIVSEMLRRTAARAPTAAETRGLFRMRDSWDCTGQEFTCGEYQCTGTVGCSSVFKCTVKFSG